MFLRFPSNDVLVNSLPTGRLIRIWVKKNNPNASCEDKVDLVRKLSEKRNRIVAGMKRAQSDEDWS